MSFISQLKAILSRLFSSREPRVLLVCQIHGSHYYQCFDLLAEDKIALDEQLILKREPSNPHDENAIEVYTLFKAKLGYIPRRNNRVIANLMDRGETVTATVTGVNPFIWEPVTIRVELH